MLRALAPTPVPVPRVWGESRELGCLLLSRVPGRSDFPAPDPGFDGQPVAGHLMQLAGTLHRLAPDELDIPHLARPESAGALIRELLSPIARVLGRLGERVDPLFAFSLGWLERHAPAAELRWSLVHSDLGPGNFLHEAGEVKAILDWEVAHYGDPMEDLAALSVRDMATPVGPLSRRFREYEEASGVEVDLRRVGYYRALVLTRNALLIELGLASPPPGYDTREMTMYATLLTRAAALVLCDNLGVERPEAPGPGSAGEELELEDLGKLLGAAPASLAAGEAALRELVAADTEGSHDDRLAPYLAGRLLRVGERRRDLMGPLADRLPEPLEKR